MRRTAVNRRPLSVKLRQGKLDKPDTLVAQVLFFTLGCGPPDISPVFFSMVNPEGDLRKFFTHIIEVLMDVLLKFPEDLQW